MLALLEGSIQRLCCVALHCEFQFPLFYVSNLSTRIAFLEAFLGFGYVYLCVRVG
jgi:hypothetical protein